MTTRNPQTTGSRTVTVFSSRTDSSICKATKQACSACGGTGIGRNGKTCGACAGTGTETNWG